MQIITSPFYYAQGSVTAQASMPAPTAAPAQDTTPRDLLPKPSEVIAAAKKAAPAVAGVPVDMTTLAVLGVPFMLYGLTGLLLAGGGLYLYNKRGK